MFPIVVRASQLSIDASHQIQVWPCKQVGTRASLPRVAKSQNTLRKSLLFFFPLAAVLAMYPRSLRPGLLVRVEGAEADLRLACAGMLAQQRAGPPAW